MMRSMVRMSVGSALFLLCIVILSYEMVTKVNFNLGHVRPWQTIVNEKREKIMAKIPPQWRLSATILAESKERRVLVGDYLKGLLDHVILSVTNLDVPEVVTSTSNGSLTAKQVAKHFARELHMHISWLVSSTSIFSGILMTSI